MEKEMDYWAAGFFDGEGCLVSQIGKPYDSYIFGVGVQVNASINEDIDKLVKSLKEYNQTVYDYQEEIDVIKFHRWVQSKGVNSIIYSVKSGMNDSEVPDVAVVKITKPSDVQILIEELYPNLSWNKKRQCDIYLKEIIPRLKEESHKNSRVDFLEIVAWKELCSSLKGTTGGNKYTLNFFEEKWNMKLPSERHPPNIEELTKDSWKGYDKRQKELHNSALDW